MQLSLKTRFLPELNCLEEVYIHKTICLQFHIAEFNNATCRSFVSVLSDLQSLQNCSYMLNLPTLCGICVNMIHKLLHLNAVSFQFLTRPHKSQRVKSETRNRQTPGDRQFNG